MANIKLDVALNLDDSQYKSGVKSVEQSLKKFSTTPAFVKLKLDESDFRKQYQDLVKSSIAEIDKLNALQYKTKGGAVKIANSTGTMQSAYKYHLEMSQNEKLSKAERNRHAASELALRRHLNLISLIGLETKAQAKIQAQERAMPARLEQAKRSGQVAAAKKRAYDAEFAEEKRQKKDDELYRRRYLAFAAEESKIERERAARIAQLQREADQRAKATRNQYDQRIAAGTDTRTPELDALRRQYQEEERLAANAAKMEKQHSDESAKQLSNRVKARRNAKDIEVALENEKIAREKVSAAQERTNANRTKENIEKEIKALKDLKRAEDDLDKAQGKRKRNSRVSSATNQRIQELQTELDALRNNSNELDKQSGLLKRLGSLAARYFSIQQIVQFGRKIAETTGYFQKQQVALEGILQSATDARKVLNDISNFALQSPFRTDELVRFTKQLSAFGIDTADLFPTVKQLADISAGLGVDMDRIILAYGQVESASVLRGQELRQFTEAGIPMVQALADKFTKMNGELVTTADIFEMISKRQVSFEVVADVLSDMTKEGGRFYKMQENVTNTLYGQIQKLKDLWTLALKDIGNSAGGFLNGIVSLLQKVVSNAKMVSTALAAAFVGNWIGKNIYGIVRIITHLKSYIRLLRVAATLNKSAFIGFGLGAALAVGVGAFVKIKDELTKVKRKMQEISDSFTKETNKMIDGVNALIKRMRAAAAGSKEWNDALETLKNNYGEYLDVNDAVLQKVIQGIDLNKEEKKSFDDLSESIAAAIKLKKEYEELTAKKNEAENLISAEFAAMFKRNSKMLVSQIGEQGNLNEFFGTNYDKAINPQISSRVEAIFKSALDAFTSYRKTSFEDFKTIFKTMLNNEFIGSDLKGNSAETIIDSYLKTTFSSIKGSSVFAEYLNIVSKLSGEGTSLFDSMVRINRLFEDNKFSPMENTPLGIHKEREDFYRDIFGKGLTSELNAIVNQEGTKKSKEAFLELMAIVADTEKGTYDVYVAFDNLLNAVADPERRRVIADAANLYKKHTDALTDDEMALAKNLEGITEFTNSVVQLDRKNKFKTQEYFEKWNPSVKGDQTIEQTREEISTEYQSLKKELDTYLSKDAEIFANEIKVIQEKMKVLEKIAGSSFYNVDLTDDKKGGAKQLPPELADFLSSLKNAYQRYNESVDKGGIGIGLNYVRTNEMFQEMFGEFFGGAEGEKFKALSGMKVGSHTVGELLSGKFLEGLEEGVIDFKAAALALAEDLESTNIKSYKQAGKQLRQWVDSTISKDSLNATMNELEKTIKDLTNSFEKANKEVDLYRKLQENGTAKALGGQIGINAAMATTPDSVRMQGQIQTLLASLNEQLAAQSIAPLSLGSLSRIDEVYNAIENLGKITMMNNKAFDGTALGKIGDNVNNLLKQLLETLIKEAASISGEVYTGNTMSDLIANAKNRINGELFDLTKQENVARAQNTYDMGAIKAVVEATQEEAQKLFDQLLKENNFDVLARSNGGKIDTTMLDELKQKLTDIANTLQALLRDELLGKIDDLENAVADYNAKVAAPGSMMAAFNNYKNAGTDAKEIWGKEEKLNLSIATQLETPELRALLSEEEIDDLEAQLAASEKRLEDMGGSAEALEEKLKKLAIDNLQKSAQEAQSTFNAIAGAANSVIDVFQSLSNTINKVYDVMNDGENPKWMKDMDGFLNDFADSFQTLIAPITAVMAAIVAFTVVVAVAGTTMGIVFGALIAAAAIFALVIAAIQSHDRNLQATIEDLEKHIEDTKTAMTNLDAAAERMVGIKKFETQLNSLSKNLDMYKDSLAQAKAEQDKKDTDTEKVKEYQQNAQEYLDAFRNGMKEAIEEVTFSVEDMASKISDAMRSAFQSGENAARAMRDVVKESIGDIIQNLIELTYLQPALQSVFEDFLGMGIDEIEKNPMFQTDGKYDYKKATDYFIKRANDPDAIENLSSGMEAVTQGNLDIYNALDPILQHYMSYSGGSSNLSGGISGISEDTARSLEGLSNSILMQQVISNGYLSSINDQFMAVVQTNWFNQMLTHTKNMDRTMGEVRSLLQNFESGISNVHVKMS